MGWNLAMHWVQSWAGRWGQHLGHHWAMHWGHCSEMNWGPGWWWDLHWAFHWVVGLLLVLRLDCHLACCWDLRWGPLMVHLMDSQMVPLTGHHWAQS